MLRRYSSGAGMFMGHVGGSIGAVDASLNASNMFLFLINGKLL